MSHHSNVPFNPDSENFKKQTDKILLNTEERINWGNFTGGSPDDKPSPELIKREEPGATNNFPEGKLTPDDLGEIKMNIGLLEGKVIINFGKLPITWVAMTKDQALELANIIIEKANILKPI